MTSFDDDDLSFIRNDISSIVKQIPKSSNSVKNRIRSIIDDSQFVLKVKESYQLPLVANERCGRWYIPSGNLDESVYFKSTDGHTNQWDFSTRRLNFHIVDLIVRSNGMILIDSTRKGKSIPDALSKTVPVWCSVINSVLFNKNELFFPPEVVSLNEQNSIKKKFPLFVENLLTSNALNVPDSNGVKIGDKLKKPLRPIWVTPNSFDISSFDEIQHIRDQGFYPIVCCTASKNIKDDLSYIQGAADDHETWAHPAFDSEMLWNNLDLLRNASLSDEELLDLIKELSLKDSAKEETKGNTTDYYSLIKPSNVAIGKASELLSFPLNEFSIIIDLSEQVADCDSFSDTKYLKFATPSGKKGSNSLRQTIPVIVEKIKPLIDTNSFPKTLIICDTGIDFCVGVCLSLICLFPPNGFDKALSKQTIRQRLVWIVSQRKVNPSRSTLNSVNSFIMG